MKRLKDEKGFIKGLLCVLVFAAVIFAGITVAIPYYHYYTFKNEMGSVSKSPFETSERFKAELMERSKKLNVPVTEEDVEVEVSEKNVEIKARWTEKINFFDIYQRDLKFEVNVREAR